MEQEQIAALVKQNDNAARRALFEEFYQRTFAAVFQIVRSRETAEDLAQDAFVKAFHNLPKLREAKKFGAWLMAIATNLARNHLKREKRLVYADDFSYQKIIPETTPKRRFANGDYQGARRLRPCRPTMPRWSFCSITMI